MATKSSIEWTGSTWNPTIGCSEQSPGCTNCYAVKMAYRLMHIEKMKGDYHGLAKRLPNGKIVWTGEVTALEKRLIEPLQINRPTTFFVNSMSDLFHPAVPFEFINKVFVIMALTPNHTYQILTKQPKRAVEYFKEFNDGLPGSRDIDEMVTDYREFMFDKNGQISAILRNAGWFYENRNSIDGNDGCISYVPNVPLKNVWIGTSVENQKTAQERIPYLLNIPTKVLFLSCEPLLGPIVIHADYLKQIKWIICGGESGNSARPMHPDWARGLRDQCEANNIPYFFKQWGEYLPFCQSFQDDMLIKRPVKFPSPNNPAKENVYYKIGKHESGSLLDGKEWKEMPAV